MKPITLFIVLYFVGINFCFSQYTIFLNTQNEVDSFAQDSVFGSVSITSSDIKDIKNLKNLVFVSNDLIIKDCPRLKKVNSIENLIRIWGNLRIENNDSIEYLESPPTLDSCSKISIKNNKNLKYLDLYYTADTIIIDSNENLFEIYPSGYKTKLVKIANNLKLFDFCEIAANSIDNETTVYELSNNGENLSTITEIREFCRADLFPCGALNLTTKLFKNNHINDLQNCSKYLGSMHIELDSITDLNSLSNLNKINGNISIQNCMAWPFLH